MKKSVAVALIKNNKVLMQLRENKPDVIMAGHWGLLGGLIKGNETLKQAAIREFQEETGYKLKNPILLAVTHYTVKIGKVKTYVFYEIYDKKQKINCYEGERMDFKSSKDLKKLKTIPRHDEFAQKALSIVEGTPNGPRDIIF